MSVGSDPRDSGHARIENRKIRRQRVLKGAKILIDRTIVIDCTVRNVSETGACLQLPSPVGVPNRFEVMIGPDNAPRPCQLIWRSANQIGIAFTLRLRKSSD